MKLAFKSCKSSSSEQMAMAEFFSSAEVTYISSKVSIATWNATQSAQIKQ